MVDIPLSRWVRLGFGANLHTGSTVDYSVATDQLTLGVSVPTQFIMRKNCTVSNGVCYSPSSQQTSHQSTWGYYVEPRLNFHSRFFVAPGFRLDGGSGGSKSAGSWGSLSGFPKMDFSYVAVDRQGDDPLAGFLTLLRPRLAFGLSGRQPGVAQKLRLYNVGFSGVPTVPGQYGLNASSTCGQQITLDGGATYLPAVCLNTLGNTQLRPERTGEMEGGGEASLWNGRMSVNYTYSQKVTHDAIIAIPVAPSVYSANIEKNIGVVRNVTNELSTTLKVLESRAVGLSFDANWSSNENKVVRLNKGVAPLVFSSGATYGGLETRVEAGYPVFGVFARPIAGLADANGDGIIQSNEIRYGDSTVYLGRPDPKSQIDLTSHLTLLNGHLGIHAAAAYQDGMTQDNSAACQTGAFHLLPNNPSTTLATQAAVVAAGCFGSAITNIGLAQTVNTFRFRSVSVNYVLPKLVAGWFRVPQATMAVQGQNLWLHTNYRGIDPNVNAFSTVSAGDRTADTGQIPLPRTWTLRLTLGGY